MIKGDQMAFVTKKYTRPVLQTELKKVSASSFTSLKVLASVISPRAGTRSAKIAALRSIVSSSLLSSAFILNDGKSNKTFLLNLLRNS